MPSMLATASSTITVVDFENKGNHDRPAEAEAIINGFVPKVYGKYIRICLYTLPYSQIYQPRLALRLIFRTRCLREGGGGDTAAVLTGLEYLFQSATSTFQHVQVILSPSR